MSNKPTMESGGYLQMGSYRVPGIPEYTAADAIARGYVPWCPISPAGHVTTFGYTNVATEKGACNPLSPPSHLPAICYTNTAEQGARNAPNTFGVTPSERAGKSTNAQSVDNSLDAVTVTVELENQGDSGMDTPFPVFSQKNSKSISRSASKKTLKIDISNSFLTNEFPPIDDPQLLRYASSANNIVELVEGNHYEDIKEGKMYLNPIENKYTNKQEASAGPKTETGTKGGKSTKKGKQSVKKGKKGTQGSNKSTHLDKSTQDKGKNSSDDCSSSLDKDMKESGESENNPRRARSGCCTNITCRECCIILASMLGGMVISSLAWALYILVQYSKFR